MSPEDQAMIDALNAFPKDDPIVFYGECMKHVPAKRISLIGAVTKHARAGLKHISLGKG